MSVAPLHGYVVGLVKLVVRIMLAPENAEFAHILQAKLTRARTAGHPEAEKVCAIDVVEPECRPRVRRLGRNFKIADLDIPRMPHKQARRGKVAKHRWLGILLCFLRRIDLSRFRRASAHLMQVDITDLHVFDRMPGYAGNNRGQHVGVAAGEIADEDPLQRADLGFRLRPAQPRSQPQEEGRGAHVAHGYANKGNVLADRAVHGLQRETPTTFEHTVRDCDVLEAAIRLRAALDAPRSRGASGDLYRLPGSIEH